MARPSPKYAKNETLVALGSAIRSARQAVGMSQEDLAEKAGLDRSYTGGLERGEHNVTLMGLVNVAGALEMRLSELLSSAEL